MSHGGDRYRNKVRLDFSVNTNPAGVLESVRQSLINSISKAEHYPDIDAFTAAYLNRGKTVSEKAACRIRTAVPADADKIDALFREMLR